MKEGASCMGGSNALAVRRSKMHTNRTEALKPARAKACQITLSKNWEIESLTFQKPQKLCLFLPLRQFKAVTAVGADRVDTSDQDSIKSGASENGRFLQALNPGLRLAEM
ncbi:MAG: hypothetical protein HYV04_10360, partial [Deltaproteobacteria bacterium]|nr:hypothetical protein [Deltaproteobacteria bacterium]